MRGIRLRVVALAAAALLVAGCAGSDRVEKDWITADTVSVAPGDFRGVETTFTRVKAEVWDTNSQQYVEVGQLMAEHSTPLGKQLATAFVGSVVPAAVGGGLGVLAADVADCDDCSTNISAIGGIASAGSQSVSGASAGASATIK